MTTEALPFILLQGVLFGSTLIASRFSVGQFSPTTYLGLRLTLASLAHLVVYLFSRERRWPRGRRLWTQAAILGILGTALPMTAIVSSLQYQSSGVTSVLITAGPALTVLLAHFLLPDERLTPRKSAGVVLALGGALLLAARGESGLPDVTRANPLGYGLVAMALLLNGGMTIFARRRLRNFDAFDVASIRMFIAALTVTPLSTVLVGLDLSRVDNRGYFALLYAALIGTFTGLLLAFFILQRFGATASAMPAYAIPIVATLGGAWLLDETITTGMLAGMLLIIAGVSLINQWGRAVQVVDQI